MFNKVFKNKALTESASKPSLSTDPHHQLLHPLDLMVDSKNTVETLKDASEIVSEPQKSQQTQPNAKPQRYSSHLQSSTKKTKPQAMKMDFVCETDPVDFSSKQRLYSQTPSQATSQQNFTTTQHRGTEVSSSHSRSMKDLSSMDYLRLKRAQSREKGDYYDLKNGAVYRNYKYEKLKLQRPELAFLENKPLDFVGRSFAAPIAKDASGNVTQRTENAIENLKRQRQIVDFGAGGPFEDSSEVERQALQEIKKRLQTKIVSSQHNLYPFDLQAKIAKDLKKLDDKISYSFMSNSRISDLPSVYSTATTMTPSESQSTSHSAAAKPVHWVSPLIKHESMKGKNQSGSELILKNELVEAAVELRRSHTMSNRSLGIHQYQQQQRPSRADSTSDETGLCLSVIHFNKGFKGKGEKMRSLIKQPIDHKEKKKSLVTGEVIVNHVQKESQYLRLVKEYNRLLEMDKLERAIARTRKIKTKRDERIDDIALHNKLGDLEHQLTQEMFLRETVFFDEALRPEKEIRERILHGISSKYGGIAFEGYLNFYKIFLFQNTERSVLIDFLVKYFCYSPRDSRMLSSTKESFVDELVLLSNHKGLLDAPECIQAWKKGLEMMESIALVDTLREKHIKEIFVKEIVSPDLILKLLFS